MKHLGILFLLLCADAAIGCVQGSYAVTSAASGKVATRGDVEVPFAQLRDKLRFGLSFEDADAARHLVRVELLP